MTSTDERDARTSEREVDGVRTHWVEYGDPADPPVLALHGLRGTHEGLAPIARRLTGVRVVVPDLPGFGATAPFGDRPHDVTGYARWAAALVATMPSPTVLLGHSFGTVIAAAAAASAAAADTADTGNTAAAATDRAGRRVRGLVLVNPITHRASGAGALAAAAVHEGAAVVGERAGTAVLRHRTLADLATLTMTTTTDPALRAWIRAEHRAHFGRFADVSTVRDAFRAARRGTVTRHLPGLDVPALLVAGARDRIAPRRGVDAVISRIPGAELTVVPTAGHLLHYEAPDEVADVVGDFLERLG